MADKKISQLTALSAANLAPSTDVLAIVDTSATETKKIVAQDLINGVLNVASAVGIGTASPAAKLDVRGNATFTGNATARQTADFTNTGGQLYVGAESSAGGAVFTGSSAYAGILGTNTNTALQLATNGAVRATLDASGNLGIGLTPSAWGSDYRAVELTAGAISSTTAGNTFMQVSNAAHYNGTQWIYKYTSIAPALYQQTSGQHRFLTAASGTAGNAISFTQAMTLEAGGDLKLTSSATNLYIQPSTGTNSALTRNVNTGGTVYVGIDSSAGGLGGAYTANFWHTGNYAMVFATNNTERGRFTAGGVFIVGTAPALYGELLNVTHGGVGQNCATFYFNTTDDRGNLILRHARASGATQAAMIAFLDSAGTERGSIKTDGSATAYNTSSDRRLKENIEQSDDAGEIIDSIQIVKHDWKDGGHVRYGMIAQDLYQVAAEAVSAGDDGEDIEKTWGVDYSKLVPMLVKELQSVRARLAALEAK